MFSHHGQRVSKGETIVPGVNTLDSGTTNHCVSVADVAPPTERGSRGRRTLEDDRGSFRRRDVSVSVRRPPVGIEEAVAADSIDSSTIDRPISNLGITPAGEVRTRRFETAAGPKRFRRLDRLGRSVKLHSGHAARQTAGVGRSKPLLRGDRRAVRTRDREDTLHRSVACRSRSLPTRRPGLPRDDVAYGYRTQHSSTSSHRSVGTDRRYGDRKLVLPAIELSDSRTGGDSAAAGTPHRRPSDELPLVASGSRRAVGVRDRRRNLVGHTRLPGRLQNNLSFVTTYSILVLLVAITSVMTRRDTGTSLNSEL